MAATELDVLRDKLYSRADAQLRRRVDERLDPIRQAVGLNIEVTLNGQTYIARDVINAIGQAFIDERRDQNRAAFVTKFLQKVEGIEV